MSNGNTTYLLSYPRSGNFWVRYILEFISKRPTQGYDNRSDAPIGTKHNIGVDLTALPIAVKSHREIGGENDSILLIIRDYKECITRHAKAGGFNTPQAMKDHFIQETGGEDHNGVDYIQILQRFDNFKGKKLLVYYEDLISNPDIEIKKIVDFLGLDEKRYTEFMNSFEMHKNRSISKYHAGSHSKGENVNFHASKLSNEYLKFMTEHIKTKYSNIFQKYLKRYE